MLSYSECLEYRISFALPRLVKAIQNDTGPSTSLGVLAGDTGPLLSILGEMCSKAFLGLQQEIDLRGDTETGVTFFAGRVTFRLLALWRPFIRIATCNSSGKFN